MSPLPMRMRDRWLGRSECAVGSGKIYWHILMHSYPEARAAAMDARRTLSGFNGFHMTPLKWLHISTLVAGSTDEVNRGQMLAMVSEARRLLGNVAPISVALGKVFYHPEAIALRVEPVEALMPMFSAAQSATLQSLGHVGDGGDIHSSWMPHMTVSYSTSDQPAQPIISALGRSVGERQILIDSLTLVIQWGPERSWEWERVGTVYLGHQ